jgi:predicted phage-related endonuclease
VENYSSLLNVSKERWYQSESNFIVSWMNQVQNRVDTKTLKEKYPEVYENVLKPSSFRKFAVKEAK